MIEAYRGDRDRLNYLLFMHNVRTVFSQAKAYMAKTDDYDSLVQNGMLGLAEAARRFDPDKGIKFCTYANIWVHKYLSMPYWTAQFRLDRKTVSLNAPAGDCDSASPDDTLENCVQDLLDPSFQSPSAVSVENEISACEQRDICDDMYRMMEGDSSLSATDKAVFTDLFARKEKTSCVSEKYNISQSAVSEIKRKILGKMREWMARKYNVSSYSQIA